MRILHCIYDHDNNPWVGGGGAIRAHEIYTRLSNEHEITIVCGKYPGAQDYSEGNLRYHFVGTSCNNYILSTFAYAFAAFTFLLRQRRRADIIIEDFAPYNPIFSFLFLGCPKVLQLHHKEGLNLFKRYSVLGLPFMLIEYSYPKIYHNIICVSEQTRLKFNVQRAVLISNGIGEPGNRSATSKEEYLAYIGRLNIHNKGLDTLIEAMDFIESTLIIAGKGKDEGFLHDLVRGQNYPGRIEISGYIDNNHKDEFISRSYMVILPSRAEGQGIVILEAAACGKPVIVSDIPELKYAVDAGFGLSFKTGDAEDLAEKIKYLIQNESLRKEMGARAREYAKDFTWDKIAETFDNYITSIASQNSSGR